MKILLVLNPISGGINKAEFLLEAKKLCKFYGYELQLFKTTGKDDLEKLKTAINSYAGVRIAAAGGDGTVLLVAKAILNSDKELGIVPMGSANGMAAELGVKKKPLEAFKDVLLSRIVKPLDLVQVNNKHLAIHIGDVGTNAEVVKKYDQDKSRGMLTYIKHYVNQLKEVEPFEIVVKHGENEIKEHGIMLAICNARKYGTGIPLNKISNPFDGKLELVIIHEINFSSILKLGLSALVEDYQNYQESTVLSGDEFTVSFKNPKVLQLDGEVIDEFRELQIKLIPSAVNLVLTGANPY